MAAADCHSVVDALKKSLETLDGRENRLPFSLG